MNRAAASGTARGLLARASEALAVRALLALVLVVGIVCGAGYALAFRYGELELILTPGR